MQRIWDGSTPSRALKKEAQMKRIWNRFLDWLLADTQMEPIEAGFDSTPLF